jgi:hypothetical protein
MDDYRVPALHRSLKESWASEKRLAERIRALEALIDAIGTSEKPVDKSAKDSYVAETLAKIVNHPLMKKSVPEVIAAYDALEAELAEVKLQRDSWKRIAESGLGLPQTETKGNST